MALLASSVFPCSPAYGNSIDGLTNLHLQTDPIEIGDMRRGDIYHGTFTLAEHTDIPATVKVYTSAYSMKNATYEPLYEGAESYRNTIKDWVTFPDGTDYVVPANGELDIRFTVQVPQSALGGSQYCAILVELVKEPTPATNTSDSPVIISATGRVALPVYADIDGPEVVQGGEITSWTAPSLYFSPPIKTEFGIKNTGNVRFPVDYDFAVTDVFRGDDIIYSEKASKMVFPDTERIIFHEWSGAPYLGLFNITETISFLGKTEHYSRVVLVVPLWLVVIVFIMLALAILATIKKVKEAHKAKDK